VLLKCLQIPLQYQNFKNFLGKICNTEHTDAMQPLQTPDASSQGAENLVHSSMHSGIPSKPHRLWSKGGQNTAASSVFMHFKWYICILVQQITRGWILYCLLTFDILVILKIMILHNYTIHNYCRPRSSSLSLLLNTYHFTAW